MTPEKRSSPRHEVTLEAFLSEHGDERDALPCTILDYSDGGARLRLHALRSTPGEFILHIPDLGESRFACVRWRHGAQLGVAFTEPQAVGAKIDRLNAEILLLRRKLDDVKAIMNSQKARAAKA